MSATMRVMTICLVATFVMITGASQAHAQKRERQPQTEISGTIKSLDVAANSITIAIGKGREDGAAEKTFPLLKNVEIAIGSGKSRFLFKQGKLADLAEGLHILLSLSADLKTVESIVAEGPMVRGYLKAVDAKKQTLTILGISGKREPDAEEKSYTVAADAEIVSDDGRGKRFSVKECKLEDLAEGALVTAQLSLDKKQVQSLQAEGATLGGIVKAIDPAKKTVTLTLRPAKGDDAAEERTLPVPAEAVVVLDDGRGRRLSLKEGKLADIPVGATAMVKLSVDQALVMLLKIEGPTVTGVLKSFDAEKRTITIAFGKVRGDNPEEKTFTLAKDARVTLDGAESKLADLKANDNGPYIQLRLSLDQQTVQQVMAHQPKPR